MTTYCIADCGCAGAQEARECLFVPTCPFCREANVDQDNDRDNPGQSGTIQDIVPLIVTDVGPWTSPTMDEWINRIDEGARKIEEENKQ